eukprot:4608325-Prymnesium_polylepis.2
MTCRGGGATRCRCVTYPAVGRDGLVLGRGASLSTCTHLSGSCELARMIPCGIYCLSSDLVGTNREPNGHERSRNGARQLGEDAGWTGHGPPAAACVTYRVRAGTKPDHDPRCVRTVIGTGCGSGCVGPPEPSKDKFWRGGADGRARLLFRSAARRPEAAMPPKKPESDRAQGVRRGARP